MSASCSVRQPLVEVALAYDGLELEQRQRLVQALNCELSLAEIHHLACQMLATAKPVVLAMVITRLIVMSNDEQPIESAPCACCAQGVSDASDSTPSNSLNHAHAAFQQS